MKELSLALISGRSTRIMSGSLPQGSRRRGHAVGSPKHGPLSGSMNISMRSERLSIVARRRILIKVVFIPISSTIEPSRDRFADTFDNRPKKLDCHNLRHDAN